MTFMLFSAFPSFAFLGSVVYNVYLYLTMSDTDKEFGKIVTNDEEVEDEDRELINVAIIENQAYWIHGNTFYMADIVDDEIDKNTSRPVDTINMSLYELNKMLFIIDHLNEG